MENKDFDRTYAMSNSELMDAIERTKKLMYNTSKTIRAFKMFEDHIEALLRAQAGRANAVYFNNRDVSLAPSDHVSIWPTTDKGIVKTDTLRGPQKMRIL